MGGKKAEGGNGWMSHAWVVPGCESPWGVFSGATPDARQRAVREQRRGRRRLRGKRRPRRATTSTPGEIENTPTEVGGAVELASAGN